MSTDQFSVSEEVVKQMRAEGKRILYIAIPVSAEAIEEYGEEVLQVEAAMAASDAIDTAMEGAGAETVGN